VIAIELEKDTVEAGDFVAGRIHWVREGDRSVTRILVDIAWRTDGGGNIASGVGRVTLVPVRKHQRDGLFPVRLLIPYEGPISFEGELISMSWQLRVRVDQSGFDEFAKAEFRVVPGGKG
jgi:hypothetical protein